MSCFTRPYLSSAATGTPITSDQYRGPIQCTTRTIDPLSPPPRPLFPFELVDFLHQTKRPGHVSATFRGLDLRLQIGPAKVFFLLLQIAQTTPRLVERKTLLGEFIGKNDP